MKSIVDFINETLSKDQIDKIDNLIGNRDFDDAFKWFSNSIMKQDNNDYSKKRSEIIDSINKLNKSTKKEKSRIEKIKNILDSIKPLKQNTRYNLIKKLEDKILDVYGEETWKSILKYLNLEGHDEKLGVELSDWLDEHGLDRSYIKWGTKSPDDEFFDFFDDSEKLKNLLNGKYYITIDDLIKNSGKKLIDDVLNKDVKDAAEKMLNITYTKSKFSNATMGPGEILLKAFLKGGTSGKSGDVVVKDGNKTISLELKDGGTKGHSGGIPGGQGEAAPKSFEDTVDNEVFQFFKEKFKDKDTFKEKQQEIIDDINSNANGNTKLKPTGKNTFIGYFQKKNCENLLRRLLKELNENKELFDEFIDVIVKGVEKQYNEKVNIPEKVILSVKDVFNDRTKFIDIVGFFELYCYSKIENFDYLIAITGDDSKYSIIDTDDIDNFSKVLSKISFSYVSSGSARESAARIKIDKNNKE